MYRLQTEDFQLEMIAAVHEEDMSSPVNTSLVVSVSSDGFSAGAGMDVDVRDLSEFAVRLNELYESLEGTARLEEPYSDGYMEFSADSLGHVRIRGCVQKSSACGFTQKLIFANEFDQTYLRRFAEELLADFAKYAKS